jgi:hypothetical protein
VELRETYGIAVDTLGKKLQRDGLPQLEIVGTVHLTHAAASEPSDDAVAAVQNRAGSEPAVVDVACRRPVRRLCESRAAVGRMRAGGCQTPV